MNFNLTRRKFFKVLGIGSIATMVNPAKALSSIKSGETIPVPAVLSFDSERWGVLCNGRNVFYAGRSGDRSRVNSPISRADLVYILRTLARNNARPFTGCLTKAQDGSVAPFYAVLGHTGLLKDLRNVQNFLPFYTYEKHDKGFCKSEVGKFVRNRSANPGPALRFFLSADFASIERAGSVGMKLLSGQIAPEKPEPCDVYPMVAVARDAYAIDYRKHGSGVDWNVTRASILNEDWLIRYEVAASV